MQDQFEREPDPLAKLIVPHIQGEVPTHDPFAELKHPAQEALLNTSEPIEGSRAVNTQPGLARYFEYRPEYLFGQLIPKVIDASSVRERSVRELKVFNISDVLAGKDEVFLGFGRPNTYIVVPDGSGNYRKFAGKSLRRAPSVVEDTRGWVQSGILLHLENLPPEAKQNLRSAMDKHDGEKFWTCVNATCKILEDAGFSLGKGKLGSIYFPYQFLSALSESGLQYKEHPLDLQFIKVTPNRLENYMLNVIKDEFTTFNRHFMRAIDSKMDRFEWWQSIRHKDKTHVEQYQSAPALPDRDDYLGNIPVRISRPAAPGLLLRLFWGPHTLYESPITKGSVDEFLPEKLKAFPQENPSLVTRLKKTILFSKPVVAAIRQQLCSNYESLGNHSERGIYDMLVTHTDAQPGKYNLVLTGDKIVISKLDVKFKFVDWLMSKHVLVSGYDADLRFSGEFWKDKDGVLHLSANSGTYRPTEKHLDGAVKYLQSILPHLKIVTENSK